MAVGRSEEAPYSPTPRQRGRAQGGLVIPNPLGLGGHAWRSGSRPSARPQPARRFLVRLIAAVVTARGVGPRALGASDGVTPMRALSRLLAEVAGLSLSFRKPAAEAVRQTCRGPFTNADRRYARRRYAREARGEGGAGVRMTGRGGTCGVAGRDLGIGLSCSAPPVYLSFPPPLPVACRIAGGSQAHPWLGSGAHAWPSPVPPSSSARAARGGVFRGANSR